MTFTGENFVPEESRPDFSDFKSALYFRMGDFEEILPPFLTDSFEKLSSEAAINDHPVTWEEIAFFLNHAATKVGSQHAKQLYSGEVPTHIKRTLKQEGWLFFKQQYYVYEANRECADQPAKLSLSILQRYVNWRTVHAWLYQQLKAYSESLQQGKLYDANDELALYLKKHHLWPIVDVVGSTVDPSDEMSDHRTDNLDAILEESTEVGTYWFAPDGSLFRVSEEALYRLANKEEVTTWEKKYKNNTSLEDQNINWIEELFSGKELTTKKEGEGYYGLLARSNLQEEVEKEEKELDYLIRQQKAVKVGRSEYNREALIDDVLTFGAGMALGIGEWKVGSYIEEGKTAAKMRSLHLQQVALKRAQKIEIGKAFLFQYEANPNLFEKAPLLYFELDKQNIIKTYGFYKIATTGEIPQLVNSKGYYFLDEESLNKAKEICWNAEFEGIKKELLNQGPESRLAKELALKKVKIGLEDSFPTEEEKIEYCYSSSEGEED